MAAVFFDLVGTLVDEDSDIAAHEALMGLVRARFRLEDATGDLLGEYHLLSADLMEEERILGRDRGTPAERVYSATFAAMLRKRGFHPGQADEAWFHEAYLQAHRRHVKLFPEARRALGRTRALGVHVGLVTDLDAPMLDEHLRFLGLEGAFDSVTSAEETGALKPDPRVFEAAMAKAGCMPREALMVGDSLERDVDGALAAGMHAVLIDRHGARVAQVPRLRSLRGLPRLAKRILRVVRS